jgi:hypothetical protein
MHRWIMATLALGLGACAVGIDDTGEGTGTAEEEATIFCGGIAAFPCPDGYVCVDDPTDSCDPRRGGADCGGVCKRRGKPSTSKCSYGDPNKTWVSKDPNQCATIRFFCAEGQPFSNECGCGCDTGASCGGNTCGAGEYCCNESCGICAPEGGGCIQLFCGDPAQL